MKKEMRNLFLLVVFIVITLPIVFAITGSSSSYTSYSKHGFYIYNSSSTSYGSRGSADQIVGSFSQTYTGRFGLEYSPNTAPPTPALTKPLNNSQHIYNNLTFEWAAVTDSDGDSVVYDLKFLNDSFDEIGYVSGLTSNSHANTTLPDGWQYWTVRSYDNSDYSSWNSSYFYVDNVLAKIRISPHPSVTKQTEQSQTITVYQDARSDWLTYFNVTVTGDGQDNTYAMSNDSNDNDGSWSYTYTVPSSLDPCILTVTAYGWNNTLAENVTNSTSIIVTKPVGPAVSNPRIASFYPNVTNIKNGDSVNVVLDTDFDVLNKTVAVSYSKDGAASVTLDETGFADNGDYDYNFNYSFAPPGVGTYTVSASVTDQNDNSNSSSFVFWVKAASSVNLTTVGGTNIAVKDIQSGVSIVSGSSVNQSFVAGEYDVDITTAIGTVTLYNATLNETGQVVLEYEDKDDTSSPSNTIAVDRFSMSSEQLFSNNAQIVYDYGSSNASIINEDNLKLYKCDSEASCTWEEITDTSVDSDADTLTATFDSFSIFIVVEDIATLTATSPAAGNPGGGGGLQKASVKIITPAALTNNPLRMLLEDTVRIPLRIQNNGNKLLTDVSLSSISENPLINLQLDKTVIPSLAAGASEIVMATLTSALTEPGIYSVKLLTSAGYPQVSDESELIIAVLTVFEEKVEQIITRVVFAKDLFKEHPECLELQEILGKADKAIENKEYEKARTLTESAILGCQDMITALSLKKEVPGRLPFTKQQMIILIVVLGSVLALVLFMITSKGFGKRVVVKKEKIRTVKRKRFKFELFKSSKKKSKPKTEKKTDIWKRR